MKIFTSITGCLKVIFPAAFILLSTFSVSAREIVPRSKWTKLSTHPLPLASRPSVKYAVHNRGNIQMAIANNGTIGTYGQDIQDPFTGENVLSLVYPKNSDILYLYVGAFWIGAVVGRDTLVSTGTEDYYENQEFWPDEDPFSNFTYKSIDLNSPFYDPEAYSEQDIICTYFDTLTDPSFVSPDLVSQKPHKPLNIAVTQRTMAWSYPYADDFILFDYQIENIGRDKLDNVYMGIWIDGDVWHTSRNGPEGWNDDIVGFRFSQPAPEGCGWIDTVRVAYTADNDGDPEDGQWNSRSARSVVGVRVVRTPEESLNYSFNWWITNYSDITRDFGPRQLSGDEERFRDFEGRLGTPIGDKNKYYVMRHKEFDYDLLFTAVDHTSEGWLPPPKEADLYAQGYDARYLLSFGPFDILPGQKLPISLAVVGGENFHVNANDFAEKFDAQNPTPYYNSLNFSTLALNARWASWIYDNPGVDTDHDDNYGKYRECLETEKSFLADSTIKGQWYEGDGVPDFRGAGPPPAPRMRVIPTVGKLVVRWNGYYSENTPDIFTQEIDFEGYRVYASLDDRPGSFSLLQSYDRENYNRYIYKILPGGEFGWALEEIPFSLDSLKKIYNDENFKPLLYTRNKPLQYGGEIYYFSKQDFNASDLTNERGIHKVWPEITEPPSADSNLWTEDELTYDYGRPLPKYYEYEYIYDNILPTVSYYMSVTAFDFGSPKAGLTALETDPLNNSIQEFPLTSSDSVEQKNLDAYVYPNPYRIDGNYTQNGFEGRDADYDIPERNRRIHFANLPRVCTISIYTLDGDLVRSFEHNYPQGGPQSMHDTWDLISRNTQAVVTGIYYFVVESDTRTQVGKLVIIK